MATKHKNIDFSFGSTSVERDSQNKPYEVNNNSGDFNIDNLEPHEILKDARFLGLLRDHYGDSYMGYNIEDDDDAVNVFLADRYFKNYNTLGTGYELAKSVGGYTDNETTKTLQKAFNKLPNFWNDEDRMMSRLGFLAASVIADPLNLIGFGAGAKVGKAAATQAIKEGGTKKAAKMAALKAGAKAGALKEGLAGAGVGATFNAIEQGRDMAIGEQEGFSTTELLGTTALSGGAGAVFGAGFGGAGGRFAVRDASKFGKQIPNAIENIQANKASGFGAFSQRADDIAGEAKPIIDKEIDATSQAVDDINTNPDDFPDVDDVAKDAIDKRLFVLRSIKRIPEAISKLEQQLAETTDPNAQIDLQKQIQDYKNIQDKVDNATTVEDIDEAIIMLTKETPEPEGATPKVETDTTPEKETVSQEAFTEEELEDIYIKMANSWMEESGAVDSADLSKHWRQKIENLDESQISIENKQKLLNYHDKIIGNNTVDPEDTLKEGVDIVASKSDSKKGGRPKKLDYSMLDDEQRQILEDRVQKKLASIKSRNPEASGYYLRQMERQYREMLLDQAILKTKTVKQVSSRLGSFSGDSPENPLPKGAGRVIVTKPDNSKALGRVQSFLRKGGGQGSFLGRKPVKSELMFDELQARAEAKGIRGAIRFKSISKKTVKTNDGEELKLGEVGYYLPSAGEGKRGKVYKDLRAVKVANEGLDPINVNDAPKTKVDTSQDDVNAKTISVLEKKIAAGKGTDADQATLARLQTKATDDAAEKQFLDIVQKADDDTQNILSEIIEKKGKPEIKAQTPDKPKADVKSDSNPIAIPDGMVIAIRNAEGKIRIQTSAQKQFGEGVDRLLGKQSRENWEVGFVPEGTKGSSALDAFMPYNVKDEVVKLDIQSGFNTLSGKPMPVKSFYNHQELSEIAVDLSDLKGPISEEAQGVNLIDWFLSKDKTGTSAYTFGMTGDLNNAAMAYRIIDKLEESDWRFWGENQDWLGDTKAALYARLPERRVNPNTRENSIVQIENILQGQSKEDIQIVRNILNNLNVQFLPHWNVFQNVGRNVKNATAIQGATISPNAMQPDNMLNTINVAQRDFDPNMGTNERILQEDAGQQTLKATGQWEKIPTNQAPSLTVVHELAHWSYFNVLSPEDKAIFHKSVSKYVKNGEVDQEALAGKVYDADSYFGMNALETPQEFFAHQFTLWVNGRQNIVGSDSFWSKVYRKVQSVFNRFNDNKAIDPDLVPIFNKLLPEDELVKVKPTVKTRPQAIGIQSHLYEISFTKDELRNAVVRSGNPADIIYKLEDTVFSLENVLSSDQYPPEFTNQIAFLRDQIDEQLTSGKNSTQIQNGLQSVNVENPEKLVNFANDVVNQLEDVRVNIEDTFGKVNETPNAVPSLPINPVKAKEVPQTVEQQIAKLQQQIDILKNNNAEKTKVNRKAKAVVENKNIKFKKPLEQVDPTDDTTVSPRKLSLAELYDDFAKVDLETPQGYSLANEIDRRLRTELPKPDDSIIVPRDIMQMRKQEMIQEMHAALQQGAKGKERFNQLYKEIYRREIKRRQKNGIVPASSVRMTNAIRRESDEFSGMMDVDFIPATTSDTIRQILLKSTHRNKAVQPILRTVMYRMLNLHGANIKHTGNVLAQDPIEIKLKNPNTSATDDDFNNMIEGMMVDTNSDTFKFLRSQARRLAVEMAKDNGDPEKVTKGVLDLIFSTNYVNDFERESIRKIFPYTYVNKNELPPVDLDISAEDWFIESFTDVLAGKKSLDELFIFDNPELTPDIDRVKKLTGELTEAAAYFINDLSRNKKAKQAFPSLAVYGDVFQSQYKHLPVSEVYGLNTSVPSFAAKRLASESLEKANNNPVRMANINEYTRNNPVVFYHGSMDGNAFSKKTNPSVTIQQSGVGVYGPAFYVTGNPMVAGYYAAPSSLTAKSFDMFKKQAKTEEAKELLDGYFINRQTIDEEDAMIRKLESRQTGKNTENVAEDDLGVTQLMNVDEEIAARKDYMRGLIQFTNNQGEELKKVHNIVVEPSVTPMFIRAENSFNINTTYRLDADPEIGMILDNAVSKNLTSDAEIARVFNDATEEIDGDELYHRIAMILDDNIDASYDDFTAYAQGKARLNSILAELGYDSIRHYTGGQHKNTGKGSGGVAIALLKDGHVKHVNSPEFDIASDRLYDTQVGKGSINGAILQHGSDPAAVFATRKADAIVPQLEDMGISPSVAGLFKKINNNVVDEKSLKTAKKFSFGVQIRNNSRRARDFSNANWLADWVSPLDNTGIYERHNSLAADKYVPIRQLLNKLPDAYGWARNYANNFKIIGKSPQPKSHTKILRALRYELDGTLPQVKALTPQEMNVAQSIRKLFQEEYEFLVDSGVEMGKIKNYVPRVYDAEAVRRNMDDFTDKISSYLLREAREDKRTLTKPIAMEKAKDIANRIIDEDGTYLPQFAEKKSPHSDNIDFQRMLKLNGKELEGLEDFLINDLDSILSKYVDGSTRRGLFSQQFGYNNFGFDDYMRVGTEGVAGVADMLMSDKQVKISLRYPTNDGGMDTQTTTIPKLFAPFKDKPAQARKFANDIVAMAEAGDYMKAKAMLLRLKPLAGENWHVRTEAIINGLRDFGADGNGISLKEQKFLMNYFRVLQRKPMEGGAFHESLTTASKVLRNINAVTMLGFTTLTSIPDTFLPLIRGGSMGSFVKAWKKYSTDKHYREMLERTGLNLENVIHDKMAGMYGYSGGRATNNFFHVIGLSQWTGMQRKMAGAVGFETFRTMNRIAADLYRSNGTQTNKYRRAARILKEFGLEDYSKPDAKGKFKAMTELGEVMSSPDSDRLRAAMVKFGNETIFAPNPNDLPLWTQTPIGALMFQLKSFPLMMGRLSRKVLSEARQGNVSPLLYMATFGAGIGGVGSLAVKDLAQFRGGDDQKSSQFRDRKFSKDVLEQFGNERSEVLEGWQRDINQFADKNPDMMKIALSVGYDPTQHGTVDSFLGWYVEGLMQLGGLGMVAELLYNSSAQADNGAFGMSRTLSYILGPSFDTVANFGFNTLAAGQEGIEAAGSNQPVGNSARRTLTRQLLSRVPLFGGNRKFREGGTDVLAGTPKDTKVNNWGASGWQSGWKGTSWN